MVTAVNDATFLGWHRMASDGIGWQAELRIASAELLLTLAEGAPKMVGRALPAPTLGKDSL